MMTLTLEGYLALRHCSRELGVETWFCQLPLQDAALVRGLLSIGSQLFQQQRFADAIQFLEVAMEAGLAAPDLPEGKARALVRMGRYREAEPRLLQLLETADGQRRSGLERVLRVCRQKAEKQESEEDRQMLKAWTDRLTQSPSLDFSATRALAVLVMQRPRSTAWSQLFDAFLAQQLREQDPGWEQLSHRIQAWMISVERQEWWLQLLDVD